MAFSDLVDFGGVAMNGTPSCLNDSLWCSDPSLEISVPKPLSTERDALSFSVGLYRLDHVCYVIDITVMYVFSMLFSSFIYFIN